MALSQMALSALGRDAFSSAFPWVKTNCITAPNEKTSERESAGSPRACSGDMYPGVPTTRVADVLLLVLVGATRDAASTDDRPACLANPQSITSTSPKGPIMMF